LALEPDDSDALNNLAWLLLESDDRLAEAETLARRAVEADGPDPHLALDTLARAELQGGQCPGAVATAERALALAPAGAAERAALEEHVATARARCGAVRARP
jgi:cytochrome c-type biogenesis protein CcmH/NrfG